MPAEYLKHFRAGRYIQAHVAVVEKILGRKLPAGAEVHHVNEDKHDNRPSNLVVCPNSKYHRFLHQRTRAYDACGHVDWRKCYVCKQYDAPMNLTAGKSIVHLECAAKRSRENYWRKRMASGFFDRVQTIHTHEQMMARLENRMAGRSAEVINPSEPNLASPSITPAPTERPASLQLAWMDPVKHGDGSGFQLSVGGLYSVVRVKTDGQFRYEAFRRLPLPTLIGTSKTAPEARQCAQTDSDKP